MAFTCFGDVAVVISARSLGDDFGDVVLLQIPLESS